MRMSIRLFGFPLLCAALAFSAPAFGGEGEECDAEMMEWMKYAAPGDHHAKMAEMVGTWDVVGRMYTDPGQPPMVSKGKSVFRLVLGGRYLEQKYESEFMGTPMVGLGYSGFDNYAGKHVSFWIDNFSTGMMLTEGTCTDSCSVITESGTYPDILTGGTKKYTMVLRKTSDNERLMEMYEENEAGEKTRTMEMVYTRSE